MTLVDFTLEQHPEGTRWRHSPIQLTDACCAW